MSFSYPNNVIQFLFIFHYLFKKKKILFLIAINFVKLSSGKANIHTHMKMAIFKYSCHLDFFCQPNIWKKVDISICILDTEPLS